ncbi:DUF805 domain-containing protein [Enterovibrio paralichthyis]|uniref:DUF805 domain-containing protein n=1 Tax=Enterovibrio paralichthyis TaxID=2853805 RepID=UPI001C44D7B8|nr:DUF805 domain-containing protein [Enterovibrio paralichthyis]MBV7298021.1 DUF805 domain-containing protein [Enterovibrio paralichthyis]
MKWLFAAFWNYATFVGRARRREYLGFHVTQLLVLSVCFYIDYHARISSHFQLSDFNITLVWIGLTLLPSIAVTIRRLHDINKSGWWSLVLAVPVAGPILFCLLTLLCGTRGSNRYGYDPRHIFSHNIWN